MSEPGITTARVSKSVTNLRYRNLKERLQRSEESLPYKLRDRPDRWVPERTVAENYFLLSKHLDSVYNYFLLERTLVKRLRVSSADLVTVSRSLLSTMLVMTGTRHRQGWYSNDLPWLVSLNAIAWSSLKGLYCKGRIIRTSTSGSPCTRTPASLT